MTSEAATILVVDDDVSVLKSVARLLRSAGYQVVTFDSPGKFLAAAPWLGAHCAIVDLRMPELSGLDLQGELARAGRGLPLVFITGHGDVPASVKAMKGGAVDFLLKPFDDVEL